MKFHPVKKGEIISKYNPEMKHRDIETEQSARIASLFYDRKTLNKPARVLPRNTLREHILSVSLYPNIYNEKYLEKNI